MGGEGGDDAAVASSSSSPSSCHSAWASKPCSSPSPNPPPTPSASSSDGTSACAATNSLKCAAAFLRRSSVCPSKRVVAACRSTTKLERLQILSVTDHRRARYRASERRRRRSARVWARGGRGTVMTHAMRGDDVHARARDARDARCN